MEDARLDIFGAIPVTRGTRLRVTSSNATPNPLTAYVQYQILLKDGSVSNNTEQFTASEGTPAQTHDYHLTDGHLIAVRVVVNSQTLQAGQFFASISIIEGDVNDYSKFLQLISGYATYSSPVVYPFGQPYTQNQSEPARLTNTLTLSGAGQEMLYTAPFNSLARLTGLTFRFDTDATVATRTVTIDISEGTGLHWLFQANTNQTASQARTYYAAFGQVPSTIPSGWIVIPMPELPFIQYLTIASITTNIAGNDEYSLAVLTLDQYAIY